MDQIDQKARELQNETLPSALPVLTASLSFGLLGNVPTTVMVQNRLSLTVADCFPQSHLRLDGQQTVLFLPWAKHTHTAVSSH